MLNPTPLNDRVDAAGRPYFLWDSEMTSAELTAALVDPDPAVRGYFLGKLMRQAKPDDVFMYVSLDAIRTSWTHLKPHLGDKEPFWSWLLRRWDIDVEE